MSVLQHVELITASAPTSGLPKWVHAAMGTDSSFRLVMKNAGGVFRVADVKEKLARKDSVIMQGNMVDFKKLMEDGKLILDKKAWKIVGGDTRPDAQGGTLKWLFHQRDPEGARILEIFLAEEL